MYSKLHLLKLITNKKTTKEIYSQNMQQKTWQNSELDVQTAQKIFVLLVPKSHIILVKHVMKLKDMLMQRYVVSVFLS
jgi:hypothetical protein